MKNGQASTCQQEVQTWWGEYHRLSNKSSIEKHNKHMYCIIVFILYRVIGYWVWNQVSEAFSIPLLKEVIMAKVTLVVFKFRSAYVWKILLQVYTRAVVTQVWIEKMFNTNIEIQLQGFSPLPASVSAIVVQWYRPERIALYLGLGKTGKALFITSVFSNITFNFGFYSMLWGSKDQ